MQCGLAGPGNQELRRMIQSKRGESRPCWQTRRRDKLAAHLADTATDFMSRVAASKAKRKIKNDARKSSEGSRTHLPIASPIYRRLMAVAA